MSQSQSQGARASTSMDRGEQERKVNELVKFLLIMDQKKVPVKKQDINKHVLKEHSKSFNTVKDAAAERLEKVFGFELVELEDKQKGSFILVNKLETVSENPHLEWTEEEDSKMGLVMVVLSLIFMSGNVMQDTQLYNSLKKLGINPESVMKRIYRACERQVVYSLTTDRLVIYWATNNMLAGIYFNSHAQEMMKKQIITHEVFGDIKKLLTQELVRQGYLDMTRQPNMDPPVTEFRWGQRAKLETSKRKVLDFVSKIYGIEPQQWTSQWQDIQRSDSDEVPDTQQPSTSTQPPPSQARSRTPASQMRQSTQSRSNVQTVYSRK